MASPAVTRAFVRLSNRIGIAAAVILIFWVFTTIVSEVADLQVFKRYLDKTIEMSIIGILALMASALMLNVMMNLTRIADSHDNASIGDDTGKTKLWGGAFLAGFPLLLIILFGGDYLTQQEREQQLQMAAETMLQDYPGRFQQIGKFEFTPQWIEKTVDTVSLLERTDPNVGSVSIIIPDEFENVPAFLAFNGYRLGVSKPEEDGAWVPQKEDFILQFNVEERAYLNDVFKSSTPVNLFLSESGSYQLYVPVIVEKGRSYILRVSKYNRSGVLGMVGQ